MSNLEESSKMLILGPQMSHLPHFKYNKNFRLSYFNMFIKG